MVLDCQGRGVCCVFGGGGGGMVKRVGGEKGGAGRGGGEGEGKGKEGIPQ